MKKEFKWKLEISEIKKNCDYIVYLDDDYFRKSYLILKILNNSINSNLTSSENNDHLKICDLNVEITSLILFISTYNMNKKIQLMTYQKIKGNSSS